MAARQVGQTLLVLWTLDNGLSRKITAVVGQAGATYSREVSPGNWRHETVRGTFTTVFTDVKQLSPLVRMFYARG